MTVRIYVDAENLQDGTYTWAVAGGTADAITATYSPALPSLVDGQMCYVRATAANTTTAPTFAPNGLTDHTITKTGGSALSPGDISGAGHELILRYNLANTRWELLNPQNSKPVVNVESFGAVADGLTTSAAANLAAIQAAENYRAKVGGKLIFPLGATGLYYISGRIKPGVASAYDSTDPLVFVDWEGELGAETSSGSRPMPAIKYTGDAADGDGVFGLLRDEAGTVTRSSFKNIQFDAASLMGYVIVFEPTDTSGTAVRRENESVLFENCLFYGGTRATIMLGKYEIDDIAGLNSDGDDINCNQWRFRGCLLADVGPCAVKLVGGNIYNIQFDSCFFYKTASTVVREVYLVGSRQISFPNSFFAALNAANDADDCDTRSLLYTDTASVDLRTVQTEEPRLLYNASAGGDCKAIMSHLTINDARSGLIGCHAVYDAGGNLDLTVDTCTLGYEYNSTDYYRHIKVGGTLVWSNSILGKFKTGRMDLLHPERAVINGRKLTDDIFLNQNFNFDRWNKTSYQDGTTTDKACTGWIKTLDGGAEGTISRSSSYAEGGSRYSLAVDCTTAGTGNGVIITSETFDAVPFRGKTVFAVITGRNPDALAITDSNLFGQVSTQSSQPGFNLLTDPNSDKFTLYGRVDVADTDTTINFQVSQKITGTLYFSTGAGFLWDNDPSPAWIIARGARYLRKPLSSAQAYLTANTSGLTGDGATEATVPFNGLLGASDISFNTGTGQFTIPADGSYDFSVLLDARSLASVTQYVASIKLSVSGQFSLWSLNPSGIAVSNNLSLNGCLTGVRCVAGETAEVKVFAEGQGTGVNNVLCAGGGVGYSTFGIACRS